MSRNRATIATLAAALLFSCGLVFAGERTVSPQEKQASDQQVSNALAQEQAALAALQGNNPAEASSDLQGAAIALHSALPIYHGYRVRSMAVSNRVVKELTISVQPKNPARKMARLEAEVGRAIADAQAALQNSSHTITPEDREKL